MPSLRGVALTTFLALLKIWFGGKGWCQTQQSISHEITHYLLLFLCFFTDFYLWHTTYSCEFCSLFNGSQ